MKTTDLRRKVASIPDAGLTLEGELPAEWAAESVLGAYETRSPLSLRLDVRRVNENVLVEGRAALTLGFECSRTLTQAETRLDVRFSELFVPDDGHEFNLGDGIDSDLIEDEPFTIVDGVVDLEQLVREQLVLSQDPYPVAGPKSHYDDDDDPDARPLWTSAQNEVDPRWAGLAKLKLD